MKTILLSALALVSSTLAAVGSPQLSEAELSRQQGDEFLSRIEAVGFDASCFTKEQALVVLEVIADFLKRDDLTFKVLNESLFVQAILVMYIAEKPADLQLILDSAQDIRTRYSQYAEQKQVLLPEPDKNLEDWFEEMSPLREDFQKMQESMKE